MDSNMAIFKVLSNIFSKRVKYEPDELDKRLFTTFSKLYPRPKSINFCDYDISEEYMLELCNNTNVAFEDPSIITSFVWNSRLGFFGDWTDFPAFAGDIAIVARRECFDFEYDLVFWYFYTSEHGSFPKSIYPLLVEWVTDILLPWKLEIKRASILRPMAMDEIHYIGYLGILTNLGGHPDLIIREHMDYSKLQKQPTPFLDSINEECISNKKEIYKHFREFGRNVSQQSTPTPKIKRLIPIKNIKRIISAIESNRLEIQEICTSIE